jgi:hypothetical protein
MRNFNGRSSCLSVPSLPHAKVTQDGKYLPRLRHSLSLVFLEASVRVLACEGETLPARSVGSDFAPWHVRCQQELAQNGPDLDSSQIAIGCSRKVVVTGTLAANPWSTRHTLATDEFLWLFESSTHRASQYLSRAPLQLTPSSSPKWSQISQWDGATEFVPAHKISTYASSTENRRSTYCASPPTFPNSNRSSTCRRYSVLASQLP